MAHDGVSGSSVLSRRGNGAMSKSNFLSLFTKKVNANAYTQDRATGVCNLGTAENRLVEDMVHSKLREGNYISWHTGHGYYAQSPTSPILREEVARFLSSRRHVVRPIDPRKILAVNGVSAIFNALGQVLADSGDYFLTVSPCYPAIPFDLAALAEVGTCHVPLRDEPEEGDTKPYQLTIAKIEKAYYNAVKEGKNVKAFLHVNPNNPLGVVYDRQLVGDILQFCAGKKLHFISNEIYATSVFCEESAFSSSILSFEDWPDPARTHFVWGFSKDFGLSGLRCGIVYTESAAVLGALEKTSLMTHVPDIIQQALQMLLADRAWIEQVYLPENRKRMVENYEICCNKLQSLGVDVFPSDGAFFAWSNFRKFLVSPTLEGERDLFQRLLNAGVYIVPGSEAFCTEPGWFRIVYTVSKDELLAGLDRIQAVLTGSK